MSRVGILRALVSPASAEQLGFARSILGLCSTVHLESSAWKASPSVTASIALTCVRHIAADAGNQQEGVSSPTNKEAGSERAGGRPTLKDLLQATSQRIAQGDVSRLLEEDGPLGAARSGPPSQQSPQPQAPSVAAADGGALPLEEQLAGGLNQLGTSGALGASGLASDMGGAASAQQQQQQQRLLHPKYGYAALGGVLPADSQAAGVAGLVGMLTAQSPRINPRRRFMPGDTYEPQDLNPFAAPATAETQRRTAAAVPRPSVQEVMQKADYKNVAFLSRWFLSPAGRLLPRRQTRLPVQVHRHVSRQIKLARHMGLMAGESRLDKMDLPRLREQELAEAQRRAAEGAAAGRYNELLDFGA